MSNAEKRLQPLDAAPSGSRSVAISSEMINRLPGNTSGIGYKVFILSPAELANLGLTTRIENGKAVIMPAAKVVSRPSPQTQICGRPALQTSICDARRNLPIAVQGGSGSVHQGSVSTARRNVPQGQLRDIAPASNCQKRESPCMVMTGGFENSSFSSHGIPGSQPNCSKPVTFIPRRTDRRIIPMFAKHWTNSLKEVGFIRCPLRACNYISLSFFDMGRHYSLCRGVPYDSQFTCHLCKGSLSCKNDFDLHVALSHSEMGIKTKVEPVVAVVPKVEKQRGQILVRKRPYSKVHKISWNIALEDKGYVCCFFKNCKFLALSVEEMIQHYRICNGTGSSASIECTICDGRVETLEKLAVHITRSHYNVYVTSLKKENTTPMNDIGSLLASQERGVSQELKTSTVSVSPPPVMEPLLCGPSSSYTLSLPERRTCSKQRDVSLSVQACERTSDKLINSIPFDNLSVSGDRTMEMHCVLSGDPMVSSVNSCSEYSSSENWGAVFEEQVLSDPIYKYGSDLPVKSEAESMKSDNNSSSVDLGVHSLFSVYESERDHVEKKETIKLQTQKHVQKTVHDSDDGNDSVGNCRKTYSKTMFINPCRRTYGRKGIRNTFSDPKGNSPIHSVAIDLDVNLSNINISDQPRYSETEDLVVKPLNSIKHSEANGHNPFSLKIVKQEADDLNVKPSNINQESSHSDHLRNSTPVCSKTNGGKNKDAAFSEDDEPVVLEVNPTNTLVVEKLHNFVAQANAQSKNDPVETSREVPSEIPKDASRESCHAVNSAGTVSTNTESASSARRLKEGRTKLRSHEFSEPTNPLHKFVKPKSLSFKHTEYNNVPVSEGDSSSSSSIQQKSQCTTPIEDSGTHKSSPSPVPKKVERVAQPSIVNCSSNENLRSVNVPKCNSVVSVDERTLSSSSFSTNVNPPNQVEENLTSCIVAREEHLSTQNKTCRNSFLSPNESQTARQEISHTSERENFDDNKLREESNVSNLNSDGITNNKLSNLTIVPPLSSKSQVEIDESGNSWCRSPEFSEPQSPSCCLVDSSPMPNVNLKPGTQGKCVQGILGSLLSKPDVVGQDSNLKRDKHSEIGSMNETSNSQIETECEVRNTLVQSVNSSEINSKSIENENSSLEVQEIVQSITNSPELSRQNGAMLIQSRKEFASSNSEVSLMIPPISDSFTEDKSSFPEHVTPKESDKPLLLDNAVNFPENLGSYNSPQISCPSPTASRVHTDVIHLEQPQNSPITETVPSFFEDGCHMVHSVITLQSAKKSSQNSNDDTSCDLVFAAGTSSESCSFVGNQASVSDSGKDPIIPVSANDINLVGDMDVDHVTQPSSILQADTIISSQHSDKLTSCEVETKCNEFKARNISPPCSATIPAPPEIKSLIGDDAKQFEKSESIKSKMQPTFADKSLENIPLFSNKESSVPANFDGSCVENPIVQFSDFCVEVSSEKWQQKPGSLNQSQNLASSPCNIEDSVLDSDQGERLHLSNNRQETNLPALMGHEDKGIISQNSSTTLCSTGTKVHSNDLVQDMPHSGDTGRLSSNNIVQSKLTCNRVAIKPKRMRRSSSEPNVAGASLFMDAVLPKPNSNFQKIVELPVASELQDERDPKLDPKKNETAQSLGVEDSLPLTASSDEIIHDSHQLLSEREFSCDANPNVGNANEMFVPSELQSNGNATLELGSSAETEVSIQGHMAVDENKMNENLKFPSGKEQVPVKAKSKMELKDAQQSISLPYQKSVIVTKNSAILSLPRTILEDPAKSPENLAVSLPRKSENNVQTSLESSSENSSTKISIQREFRESSENQYQFRSQFDKSHVKENQEHFSSKECYNPTTDELRSPSRNFMSSKSLTQDLSKQSVIVTKDLSDSPKPLAADIDIPNASEINSLKQDKISELIVPSFLPESEVSKTEAGCHANMTTKNVEVCINEAQKETDSTEICLERSIHSPSLQTKDIIPSRYHQSVIVTKDRRKSLLLEIIAVPVREVHKSLTSEEPFSPLESESNLCIGDKSVTSKPIVKAMVSEEKFEVLPNKSWDKSLTDTKAVSQFGNATPSVPASSVIVTKDVPCSPFTEATQPSDISAGIADNNSELNTSSNMWCGQDTAIPLEDNILKSHEVPKNHLTSEDMGNVESISQYNSRESSAKAEVQLSPRISNLSVIVTKGSSTSSSKSLSSASKELFAPHNAIMCENNPAIPLNEGYRINNSELNSPIQNYLKDSSQVHLNNNNASAPTEIEIGMKQNLTHSCPEEASTLQNSFPEPKFSPKRSVIVVKDSSAIPGLPVYKHHNEFPNFSATVNDSLLKHENAESSLFLEPNKNVDFHLPYKNGERTVAQSNVSHDLAEVEGNTALQVISERVPESLELPKNTEPPVLAPLVLCQPSVIVTNLSTPPSVSVATKSRNSPIVSLTESNFSPKNLHKEAFQNDANLTTQDLLKGLHHEQPCISQQFLQANVTKDTSPSSLMASENSGHPLIGPSRVVLSAKEVSISSRADTDCSVPSLESVRDADMCSSREAPQGEPYDNVPCGVNSEFQSAPDISHLSVIVAKESSMYSQISSKDQVSHDTDQCLDKIVGTVLSVQSSEEVVSVVAENLKKCVISESVSHDDADQCVNENVGTAIQPHVVVSAVPENVKKSGISESLFHTKESLKTVFCPFSGELPVSQGDLVPEKTAVDSLEDEKGVGSKVDISPLGVSLDDNDNHDTISQHVNNEMSSNLKAGNEQCAVSYSEVIEEPNVDHPYSDITDERVGVESHISDEVQTSLVSENPNANERCKFVAHEFYNHASCDLKLKSQLVDGQQLVLEKVVHEQQSVAMPNLNICDGKESFVIEVLPCINENLAGNDTCNVACEDSESEVDMELTSVELPTKEVAKRNESESTKSVGLGLEGKSEFVPVVECNKVPVGSEAEPLARNAQQSQFEEKVEIKDSESELHVNVEQSSVDSPTMEAGKKKESESSNISVGLGVEEVKSEFVPVVECNTVLGGSEAKSLASNAQQSQAEDKVELNLPSVDLSEPKSADANKIVPPIIEEDIQSVSQDINETQQSQPEDKLETNLPSVDSSESKSDRNKIVLPVIEEDIKSLSQDISDSSTIDSDVESQSSFKPISPQVTDERSDAGLPEMEVQSRCEDLGINEKDKSASQDVCDVATINTYLKSNSVTMCQSITLPGADSTDKCEAMGVGEKDESLSDNVVVVAMQSRSTQLLVPNYKHPQSDSPEMEGTDKKEAESYIADVRDDDKPKLVSHDLCYNELLDSKIESQLRSKQTSISEDEVDTEQSTVCSSKVKGGGENEFDSYSSAKCDEIDQENLGTPQNFVQDEFKKPEENKINSKQSDDIGDILVIELTNANGACQYSQSDLDKTHVNSEIAASSTGPSSQIVLVFTEPSISSGQGEACMLPGLGSGGGGLLPEKNCTMVEVGETVQESSLMHPPKEKVCHSIPEELHLNQVGGEVYDVHEKIETGENLDLGNVQVTQSSVRNVNEVSSEKNSSKDAISVSKANAQEENINCITSTPLKKRRRNYEFISDNADDAKLPNLESTPSDAVSGRGKRKRMRKVYSDMIFYDNDKVPKKRKCEEVEQSHDAEDSSLQDEVKVGCTTELNNANGGLRRGKRKRTKKVYNEDLLLYDDCDESISEEMVGVNCSDTVAELNHDQGDLRSSARIIKNKRKKKTFDIIDKNVETDGSLQKGQGSISSNIDNHVLPQNSLEKSDFDDQQVTKETSPVNEDVLVTEKQTSHEDSRNCYYKEKESTGVNSENSNIMLLDENLCSKEIISTHSVNNNYSEEKCSEIGGLRVINDINKNNVSEIASDQIANQRNETGIAFDNSSLSLNNTFVSESAPDSSYCGDPTTVESDCSDRNYESSDGRDEDFTPTPSRKGKGRRPSKKRRPRGKGRQANRDRSTKKSVEDELVVETETAEIVDLNKLVQCGKCKEELILKAYDHHNISRHNGLGWLEGEPPFDTSDEKKMSSTLWKTLKIKKKRYLTCEICGKENKSVVGFMSHFKSCQMSFEEREALKVSCTLCGRFMLPASLKVHMNIHNNERKLRELQQMESEETAPRKRVAAQRAASRMQEFIKDEDTERPQSPGPQSFSLYKSPGPIKPSNPVLCNWRKQLAKDGMAACRNPSCRFKATSLEEITEHHGVCTLNPKKNFQCLYCDFSSPVESIMQSHVHAKHVNCNDSGEELEVTRRSEPTKGYLKISSKMKFLHRELSGSVYGDRPFLPALRWNVKFHSKNDSRCIFPQTHSTIADWIPVSDAECANYIPETVESMPIAYVCMRNKAIDPYGIPDLQWARFRTFESEIIEGVPLFFAGGPVWALAWCPLPVHTTVKAGSKVDQFLAVSCLRRMDDRFYNDRKYEGEGLIQLWNFGPLENLKKPLSPPRFVLGIAHEYGVVWCFAWCPSGCYEEDESGTEGRLRRLGLLAAAFSDGVIRIFPVCFPSQLADKHGMYPIFKCEVSIVLQLDSLQTVRLGGNTWNCVRVSWYEGKGHRYIAGGFGNGMVAVWDIETSSPLLTRSEGKTRVIYPFHVFQAHQSSVTALDFSREADGRFLMTGSVDCTTKIWDLEDTTSPTTMMRKGMVTDGLWLPHWPSSVSTFDDVYGMGHSNGTLTTSRGFGFKPYPLLAQNSAVWSVSSCDWINGVAEGTQAGELTAIFPHQLLLAVDTEKGMKHKRMILSFIELKDFEENTKQHTCHHLCPQPCRKTSSQSQDEEKQDVEENSNSSLVCTQPNSPANLPEEDTAVEVDHSVQEDGVSFLIERHPRIGKQCLVLPYQRIDQNHSESDKSGDTQLANLSRDSNAGKTAVESAKKDKCCFSMLSEPEKKLLRTVKKDMERLNLVSKFKVSFPLHKAVGKDSEEKVPNHQQINKSGNPDNVKVYQMVVSTCKKRTAHSNTLSNLEAVDACDSPVINPSDVTFRPGVYEDVSKKYGIILCDFYMRDMKDMPAESRQWIRKSENMTSPPVHMYPITSINKVQWNPNCRSFLWLAAGYQCGLVRVPCVSGMHNRDIDRVLQHAAAYAFASPS